jgi:hypothetical protein
MTDQTEPDQAAADFRSEPDSVDLHQYLHTLHERDLTALERQLMFVVLQDARHATDGLWGDVTFHFRHDGTFIAGAQRSVARRQRRSESNIDDVAADCNDTAFR